MQTTSHSLPILESYPPCFRPNTQQSLQNVYNDDHTKNKIENEQDQLPVIDLEQINYDKLEEACKEWGIFRLVNHGIPLTLLTRLHEHIVRMFGLGFESKKDLFGSIPTSIMSYFYGTPALTPSGDALYKKDQGTLIYNWVEGLNVPLSMDQPSHVDFHEQPLLIHDMRLLIEEYGVHQARIAKSIFSAMSQNLNLCDEHKGYMSPSTGQLRVYRYPRCLIDNPTKVWGMEVHTDSSVVTILNQYEVEGLQILSKDNAWIDAKPIPNTLIVHLGDMMQAISDDRYKSVKHRVKVNSENERISMGYFVFPDHNCVIGSSVYKPFTYSDFRAQVQQDIKTLGFKVGLSRFKVHTDS
uniref:gibberellin 2-beta-dioxygenase 8-like n=1 Tax=Erigeron canadensis TaxID=72917 RepID=UPI001CB8B8C2|nr:gibberellin 2-beta-dioxygenase 8-like [Erigeron canadensis]